MMKRSGVLFILCANTILTGLLMTICTSTSLTVSVPNTKSGIVLEVPNAISNRFKLNSMSRG